MKWGTTDRTVEIQNPLFDYKKNLLEKINNYNFYCVRNPSTFLYLKKKGRVASFKILFYHFDEKTYVLSSICDSIPDFIIIFLLPL